VRICNQYGLTETVTAGLFCGPGDGNWRIGTVGRPVDCRVRLVDEGHSEVRDGETGELLLNGDMVMDGYLNDPAATAEALVDGWLRTGDYLSCDPDGFYVFRGRRKMLIIRGGINVHPEEVTTALRRHPEVADAVTFGEKDDTFGERVESCVVLTDGAVCTSGDLVVWCREQLEEEKVPSRIHLLPALPRGAAGKVNIAETRALLAQETVIAARVATDDNIADTVRHIAAGVFNEKVDGLAIHATAADVAGWDSLAHLQLVAALEEHFHIALSTAEIMGIERLADAVRMIESRRRP